MMDSINAMERRYFKPKSWSWWIGFAAICAGVFMAFEPVHGMTALVVSIGNATDMTVTQLIGGGALAVGFRGALK